MKLPDGVNQSTACVLIALREMLDSPDWEHPYLVDNLRANNSKRGTGGGKGFTGDFPTLARHAGLYSGVITFYGRNSNDDNVRFSSGDMSWCLARQDKIIVVIRTTGRKSHAECIPATLLTTLARSKKILHIMLPMKGVTHATNP